MNNSQNAHNAHFSHCSNCGNNSESSVLFLSWKGLAPFMTSVKLWKICQQIILPDIRKCQKSHQTMGANRYRCENSFGTINDRLWLKNSNFLAIFHHFWAFLVTFMAVATTFMLTLGIGYTQRLVRYMGWWYGTIFALSSQIAMSGGCRKWHFWPHPALDECLGKAKMAQRQAVPWPEYGLFEQ